MSNSCKALALLVNGFIILSSFNDKLLLAPQPNTSVSNGFDKYGSCHPMTLKGGQLSLSLKLVRTGYTQLMDTNSSMLPPMY